MNRWISVIVVVSLLAGAGTAADRRVNTTWRVHACGVLTVDGVDSTTGAFWSEVGAQRSTEPGMQKEALSLRGALDSGLAETERVLSQGRGRGANIWTQTGGSKFGA